MPIDIATLGIKVDASQVDKAGQSLDKLAEKGGKAEAVTNKLKTSATNATNEINKAAVATQNEIAQTERLASVAQRAIDRQAAQLAQSSNRSGSTLGGESGSRETVARAASQMVGGSASSEIAAAANIALAAKTAEKAIVDLETNSVGIFARFKTSALNAFDAVRDAITNNGTRFRGLFGAGGAEAIAKEGAAVEEAGKKAHVSSIAVREILTLGREGANGNFTRMAGSATILAQSLGLLKNVTMGAIVGVGALVVGIGLLVAAYVSGAEASDHFNNSIKLSGNYAGLTASSYSEMSRSIAASTNTSIASNQSLISTLAATNNFTSAQIDALVSAAQAQAVATGASADSIIADFTRMADGPTAYAEAYQHAHIGVISPLLMQHIRELEEQGDKEQALALLIQAVTGNIAQNAVSQTGIIIRAWRGATNALSDFWTQLTRIGATSSTADRLRDLSQHIAFDEAAGGLRPGARAELPALYVQRTQLMQQMRAEGDAAAATVQHTRAVREGADAAEHYNSTYRDLTDNTGRYNRAVHDLDTTLDRMRRNNDPGYAEALAHRSDTLVAIRRQYDAGERAPRARRPRVDHTAERREHALDDTNSQLDRQIALMGLLGPAREQQQRYDAIEQSMQQKHITLSDDERTQIQGKIAQIQQLGTVQTQLDRIYDETVKPQQTYNATLEAGTQLLERHIITVPQLMNELARAKVVLDHALDPLLDFNRSFRDQADDIRFENSLLSMNAQQREVANAQRAIEIRLRDQDRTGNLSSASAIRAETDAIVANATARGQRQLIADTTREAADHIKRMNDGIRAATASFGTLFGTAGTGFSNLINVITTYRDTQLDAEARVAAARAQYGNDSVEANRVQRQVNDEMANASVARYGDMLDAAKTFFKEGSTGWKVLEGAERVYRIFQFAMAVKAMIFDTTYTATSVANSGVRAAADGVAAIAKAIASLPFPLNLIAGAATAAALIAFGVKVFGGHGGSKSASVSASDSIATYKGPVDEYGAPTSSYSVLKPGQTTVGANDNRLAPGSGSNASNVGTNISFGDTNLTINGNANDDTIEQVKAVLEQNRQQTIEDARQAAAADRVAAATRQRIGGA